MKIKVLGSGCPTCKKLYELTNKTAEEMGEGFEVEYITDVSKMIEMGIMRSPALVIDNRIALAGYLPSKEELKKIINNHSS